jgi:Spy/CpxP family protein refolding chaperone
MALKKEKETKFLEFITPEQQAKYKELVEKKKNASKSDKS